MIINIPYGNSTPKISKAVLNNNFSRIKISIRDNDFQTIEKYISGSREQMEKYWKDYIENISIYQPNFMEKIQRVFKSFNLKIIDNLIIDLDDNIKVISLKNLPYDGRSYSLYFELFKTKFKKGEGTKQIITVYETVTETIESTAHYADETWNTGRPSETRKYGQYVKKLDWTPGIIDEEKISSKNILGFSFANQFTEDKMKNLVILSRIIFDYLEYQYGYEEAREDEYYKFLREKIDEIYYLKRNLFEDNEKKLNENLKTISSNSKSIESYKKWMEDLEFKRSEYEEANKKLPDLERKIKRLTWVKFNSPDKFNKEEYDELQNTLRSSDFIYYVGRFDPRTKIRDKSSYLEKYENYKENIEKYTKENEELKRENEELEIKVKEGKTKFEEFMKNY